ncbi:hypothetical protein C8P63_13020 [Melghirimyces profundicolus]|uniref:Probable membrane transporter protein n=1 Tax=Melghirimyces profundicolus TaxID=1242148 RepID=A0A2T6B9K7_9BACL|nr:sulfite exporter TauE/SafE family protein [Melghirimyces profundicolus]PTX52708.1 hypothetical protein C8P63_13020 [Melghirimyces profundicolus]
MSFELVMILILIGLVGSFFSGMLGIGGSVITYPMLLYIPAFFGAAYYDAHDVSSLAMVQVFFATIGGVWAYRKSHLISGRLVMDMGISMAIGSLIGGYGSQFLTNLTINVLFGLVAVIAIVLMFLPDPKTREGRLNSLNTSEIPYNRVYAIVAALVVGVIAGIVGSSGGFILVPIMLGILHIPIRFAIANSLVIVFLGSIGGTAGKMLGGHVLYGPALLLIISNLLGAPLGAIVGQQVRVKMLQYALALLITGTALKVWSEILGKVH